MKKYIAFLSLLFLILLLPKNVLAQGATPHFSLSLPQIGNTTTWGTSTNSNWSTVDDLIWESSGGLNVTINSQSSSSNITLTNQPAIFQSITLTNTGQSLILPASNAASSMIVGGTMVVYNAGSNAFSILAQDGTTSILTALPPGQFVRLTLSSDSTANGTFIVEGPYLSSTTVLSVANGGTGQTSLTLNNVILGNGTSAVQFVAPGTNGNVLTDNGTTWVSAPPVSAGVPTGSLIIWATNSCPTGYLEANGASESTTSLANLFGVIGYTFGGSGGSFNIPDTRGYFIRGWADDGSIDSGRTFGSTQSDAIKSHTVSISDPGHSHSLPSGIVASSGGGSTLAGGSGFNTIPSPTSTFSATTGITASYSGATETRGINLALTFCIKE